MADAIELNLAVVVLLMILAGFFAGSVPFGVIVAKQRGVDIRSKGSGNIGATNVGRVLGVKDGLLVLFLDSTKGWLITLAASRFDGDPWVVVATGFAAVLGHCFSPWLGFKGGKGVATALGVFIVVSPALAVVAVSVFLVVAGRTRIPALGSLGAVTSATIYAFVTSAPMPVELLALATSLLLVYTHRVNLARLYHED